MDRELREAVSRADLPSVQRILQQGGVTIVNAAYINGTTALHHAAFGNAGTPARLAILQALLATPGVIVDARVTGLRTTPLCNFCQFAGMSADPQTIRVFVDAGANPNAADVDGYTPLFWAAQGCPVHVVEALLVAGADHRLRSNSNSTPLHAAGGMARLDVIQVLMRRCREAGQSELEYITLRTNLGRTPLDCLGSLTAFTAAALQRTLRITAARQRTTRIRWGRRFTRGSPGDIPPRFQSAKATAAATAATKQFLLQTYSRLLLQLHGAGCVHVVLRDANQGFHRLPENDGVQFQLPIGTLDTEHLGMLLKFILEAQPDSIRALDDNGSSPLKVAQELDLPAEVLYVLLRPRPMDLFLLAPPP